MKRGDKTIIELLQVGDRFHKQSDKTKSVYQVMETEAQIRTASQKHFICPDQFLKGAYETHKTVPIAGNVAVVYLSTSIKKGVTNG